MLIEKRPLEGIAIDEFNFTHRERLKISESSPRFAYGREFVKRKANGSGPGPSFEADKRENTATPKVSSPQNDDEITLHPGPEEVLITKSPKVTNMLNS